MMLTTASFAGQGMDEKRNLETHTYEGQVVIGSNNNMGKPAADLGEPLGTFFVHSLGLFNPFGDEAILITSDMEIEHPYSAVLATVVDPNYVVLGVPTDVDPKLKNVPLHEVPSMISADTSQTANLSPPQTAGQIEMHRAGPHPPITLGKWLEAKGTCTFTCLSDGGSEMVIELSNMLPNSLYTIWGVIGDGGADSTGGMDMVALGGLPNVFSTDENGVDRVKRVLNWCPHHLRAGERSLLFISIAFHSDHAIYGAKPAPTNWPSGLVHHTQMEFFIGVKTVEPKATKPAIKFKN
jgi:hypothetical protein